MRIIKTRRGTRFAEIHPLRGATYRVPVEMLSLAAGKDAWMREIEFECAGCGTPHSAAEMSTEYCPACVEAQEAENARLDGTEYP